MNIQDRDHEIHVEKDINIHLENKKVSMHFFWFMWLIYAVVSMTKNCFSAAMAGIVANGIMDMTETELITSMFYVVYTPMQIVGICSDRYSPEKLLKIGLVGGAVANAVIFFFSGNYTVMMVTWLANAAIQFGVWPSIFKIISSQCARSERPKMLFLISLSYSAGLFMSYGIGAILTDWRMNFSISAVALFALAVALHFYDKHIDKYMKWDKEIPTIEAKEGARPIGVFKLFLTSGFFLILIIIVLRDSFGTIVRRIAATMLTQQFEMDPSVSTLMSMLIVGTSVIGFIIIREMLHHKVIKNFVVGIIAALGISLVIAVLFIFADTISTSVISMCLMAGISTTTGLLTNTINSTYAKYGKNATAAGLANAASACGYVAPLLAVMLQEKTGSWNSVKILLIVIVALSVLTSVVLLPIYNRFNKREAENKI